MSPVGLLGEENPLIILTYRGSTLLLLSAKVGKTLRQRYNVMVIQSLRAAPRELPLVGRVRFL